MFADSAMLWTATGRGVVLAGMLLLVGAATCTWLVPARAIARPMRLAAVLLLLGVATQSMGQLLAFEAFGADAPPVRETVGLICATSWGRGRGALLLLAAGTFLLSWMRGRTLDLGVRAMALAVLVLLPWLGHAASSESVVLLSALTLVHAGAAAVWLGVLALLAPSWWQGVPATLRVLPRYGRMALVSAPVVMATGVLTAWTRLATPMDLLATPYGRLLLAKMLAVGVTLSLGARHHRGLTGDAAGATLPHHRRSLQVELLLAVVLLGLTGWLGESAPPAFE